MNDDPESAVLTELAARGVEHELIPIDPAHADTAVFCETYGYPLAYSANCIVVASRDDPPKCCACVVLATSRLDVNKTVRKLMGVKRASFASAGQMQAATGMEVGGVTPFALPPDLPLYVDARVMDCPWVIVGTGGRTSKLKLAPAALSALPGAQVIDGLAKDG